MAETPPKKKTETAADAPQGPGAAPSVPPSPAPTPPKAAAKEGGRSPTAFELELLEQVESLKAELRDREGGVLKMIDRLGEVIGASIVKAQLEAKPGGRPQKRAKIEVPPEFKGSRTYIVGPKGAYQHNKRFVQGERITIVDQFPSTDWSLPPEGVVEAPRPVAKQGRASDQNVG